MAKSSFLQIYIFALIGFWGISACTVKPKDQLDFAPIYSTHPVHVGISIPGSFQNVEFSHPLVDDINVGEASVKLYLQVFNTMFKKAGVLPKWPPWRIDNDLNNLDGIIELDTFDFKLSVGNDGWKPSTVSIRYKICLYHTDGKTIDCWSTCSNKFHQRKPFEFDLASSSLQPVIEDAMRSAIADFMISFQSSKSVNSWIKHAK